jgi:hypothetical protein
MTSQFQITEVSFGDAPGVGIWLDMHYRQHLMYNDILAALDPPQILPVYDLLVIAGGDAGLRFWLDSHETWHELVRPFANVIGINLADVDFRKPDQFYQWLDLHAQEHADLDLALGAT